MNIKVEKLVEAFEPRYGRSFSDGYIAEALAGIEFPAKIQVVGSYSDHFGWTKWVLIVPNGNFHEGSHSGSAVTGKLVASYNEAIEYLSSFEDKYYIEHPEDRVELAVSIPDEGIEVSYFYLTDKWGEIEETRITFPREWGIRKKINKASWLLAQEEVGGVPYLSRAIKVWLSNPR